MFAGPNGSGKSTIIQYLAAHQVGAYLNADELEKELNQSHSFRLSAYHPDLDSEKLIQFLQQQKRPDTTRSGFLMSEAVAMGEEGQIIFNAEDIDSYLAARIIDFIRFEFLERRISFTFETVMSHISKVEFLKEAQARGFRTYLYYVATVDPEINIARVHYRVQTGGHVVPEHKIRSRYERSLKLLMSAIEYADRAYIFDNSSNGQAASFIAEIEDAERLKLNPEIEQFPKWFVENVLNEFV